MQTSGGGSVNHIQRMLSHIWQREWEHGESGSDHEPNYQAIRSTQRSLCLSSVRIVFSHLFFTLSCNLFPPEFLQYFYNLLGSQYVCVIEKTGMGVGEQFEWWSANMSQKKAQRREALCHSHHSNCAPVVMYMNQAVSPKDHPANTTKTTSGRFAGNCPMQKSIL